jgi:undecaprenyl diphosphate synthase
MKTNVPNHIGIIPDGNRRYSEREKIPLFEAYKHGAYIAFEVISWAYRIGVKHVSFFGTSNENVLSRSKHEMQALRKGVIFFLSNAFILNDVAVHIVGDIEGIAQTPDEKKIFLEFKRRERRRGKLVVHADVNYSGEIRSELDPLFKAIRRYGIRKVSKSPEKFISSAGVPPVDLVIRTGGKPRLSGFLPFQTTYAELYFKDMLWGDFKKKEFDEALEWFTKQDRSNRKELDP